MSTIRSGPLGKIAQLTCRSRAGGASAGVRAIYVPSSGERRQTANEWPSLIDSLRTRHVRQHQVRRFDPLDARVECPLAVRLLRRHGAHWRVPHERHFPGRARFEPCAFRRRLGDTFGGGDVATRAVGLSGVCAQRGLPGPSMARRRTNNRGSQAGLRRRSRTSQPRRRNYRPKAYTLLLGVPPPKLL